MVAAGGCRQVLDGTRLVRTLEATGSPSNFDAAAAPVVVIDGKNLW